MVTLSTRKLQTCWSGEQRWYRKVVSRESEVRSVALLPISLIKEWPSSANALIAYKLITTSTPSYLNNLLAVHIPAGPTRRSSTRPLLTVPHIASDFARRSFCFVSPTVWNSLPGYVQSSPSQACFKSRLKTYLFDIAFNHQPELWHCVKFTESVILATGAL